MHGTLSRQDDEQRQTRIALNMAPPQLTLRLAPYLLVCRAHPSCPSNHRLFAVKFVGARHRTGVNQSKRVGKELT